MKFEFQRTRANQRDAFAGQVVADLYIDGVLSGMGIRFTSEEWERLKLADDERHSIYVDDDTAVRGLPA